MQSARTWWGVGHGFKLPATSRSGAPHFCRARLPSHGGLSPAPSSPPAAHLSLRQFPGFGALAPRLRSLSPPPNRTSLGRVGCTADLGASSGGVTPAPVLSSTLTRAGTGQAWPGSEGPGKPPPRLPHLCCPHLPSPGSPPPAGRRPQEGARLIAQDKRFQLITQTNEREDPAGQRALCPPHFLRTACAFARGRPRRYQPQRAPTARRARALCGHCIPRNPRASCQPPRKQTSSPAFGADAGPEGFASSRGR